MEYKNEMKGFYSVDREMIIRQKDEGSTILEFWLGNQPMKVFSFSDLRDFLMREDLEKLTLTDEEFEKKWGMSKETFEIVHLNKPMK